MHTYRNPLKYEVTRPTLLSAAARAGVTLTSDQRQYIRHWQSEAVSERALDGPGRRGASKGPRRSPQHDERGTARRRALSGSGGSGGTCCQRRHRQRPRGRVALDGHAEQDLHRQSPPSTSLFRVSPRAGEMPLLRLQRTGEPQGQLWLMPTRTDCMRGHERALIAGGPS